MKQQSKNPLLRTRNSIARSAMTMLVVDYSEARAFFQSTPEWQAALSRLNVYFTCPIGSILTAGITMHDYGETSIIIKHWVQFREESERCILLEYRGAATLLLNDGPLTQLFTQQVLAPIQKAQTNTNASNANVVQRLDAMISRLDALPPCGAGLDYQAASDRIAPAFAATAAVGSKHPRTP